MRFVAVVALLFACAFSARAETYVYIQSTQMSSSSTGGNTAWQCNSDRCWYLASDVMTDGVIDAEKLKTAAPAQISKPQPGDSVIFAAYQGVLRIRRIIHIATEKLRIPATFGSSIPIFITPASP